MRKLDKTRSSVTIGDVIWEVTETGFYNYVFIFPIRFNLRIF